MEYGKRKMSKGEKTERSGYLFSTFYDALLFRNIATRRFRENFTHVVKLFILKNSLSLFTLLPSLHRLSFILLFTRSPLPHYNPHSFAFFFTYKATSSKGTCNAFWVWIVIKFRVNLNLLRNKFRDENGEWRWGREIREKEWRIENIPFFVLRSTRHEILERNQQWTRLNLPDAEMACKFFKGCYVKLILIPPSSLFPLSFTFFSCSRTTTQLGREQPSKSTTGSMDSGKVYSVTLRSIVAVRQQNRLCKLEKSHVKTREREKGEGRKRWRCNGKG